MKRAVWLVLLVVVLLSGGMKATSASVPDVVLIKGFWFADGILADELRSMECFVIPNQAVRLYEGPSLTTSMIAEIAPGTMARLREIAFEAYPGQHAIRATAAVKSLDGRISLEPGDIIRLVSFQGDAMAAYVGDELVLVDVYGLKLNDQIRPEWKEKLRGGNQWLLLGTPDGKEGWTRFYADGVSGTRGRWKIQPRAAGGSGNFNSIIFADAMPRFQRLPLVANK